MSRLLPFLCALFTASAAHTFNISHLARLEPSQLSSSELQTAVYTLIQGYLALEARVALLERNASTELCGRCNASGQQLHITGEPILPARSASSLAQGNASHALGTRTINMIYGLWDSKPMPADFAANLETWRRLNPGWEVRLWDRKAVRELWSSSFPEFRDLWRRSRPIQRADIARLMIVLHHGGAYADLDCVPSKSLDEIFFLAGFRDVQHGTVLCIEDEHTSARVAETAYWPIRRGVPEFPTRIANYVFWAKPGAAVLRRALALAASRVRSLTDADYTVAGSAGRNNPYAIIYSTGPDVLTEAAFPAESGRNAASDVLVLPRAQCSMVNRATGTWIGDHHPAWDRAR